MKVLGCLLTMVFIVVVFLFVLGTKLFTFLFGINRGGTSTYRTMEELRRNLKKAQEQMKQDSSQPQSGDNKEQVKYESFRHHETSQQRTDTTSPGVRKVIPDNEGEYVSYEEIKDKP